MNKPTEYDAPSPAWVWCAQCGFVPALAYVAVIILGAAFDVLAPARLLRNLVLETSWGAPTLFIAVVGGAVMTILSSLIIDLGPRHSRFPSRACGWGALALLILCVPLLTFGVLFALFDD